jgi:hypothetical protein
LQALFATYFFHPKERTIAMQATSTFMALEIVESKTGNAADGKS